jgi:hypothetical protein
VEGGVVEGVGDEGLEVEGNAGKDCCSVLVLGG